MVTRSERQGSFDGIGDTCKHINSTWSLLPDTAGPPVGIYVVISLWPSHTPKHKVHQAGCFQIQNFYCINSTGVTEHDDEFSWEFLHQMKKLQEKWWSGSWFNMKMSSYQYRKSHCGDKTVVRSSYLHNGISYTGNMPSLYWINPLVYMAPVNLVIIGSGNGLSISPAPSHYLNQCRLIANLNLWKKVKSWLQFKLFHRRKSITKCHLQNVCHFV